MSALVSNSVVALQRDIKLAEDAGEAGTQGQAKGRQRYVAQTTPASSKGGKLSNMTFGLHCVLS